MYNTPSRPIFPPILSLSPLSRSSNSLSHLPHITPLAPRLIQFFSHSLPLFLSTHATLFSTISPEPGPSLILIAPLLLFPLLFNSLAPSIYSIHSSLFTTVSSSHSFHYLALLTHHSLALPPYFVSPFCLSFLFSLSLS